MRIGDPTGQSRFEADRPTVQAHGSAGSPARARRGTQSLCSPWAAPDGRRRAAAPRRGWKDL
eukprot:11958886-Alexandrium_andersonii.AAC.2